MNEIVKQTITDMFYMLGSSSLSKRVMHSRAGKITILMYHRVLPANEIKNQPFNFYSIVSLERFEEQLKFLVNNYRLISLDNITEYYLNNDVPAAVITFDDGFKDNLEYALPVLKKYKVPGTIFITTRFPEGDCSIWWFEIEEICDSRLSLKFSWMGENYFWDLSKYEKKKKCFLDLRTLILKQPNKQLVDKLLDTIRQGGKAKTYDNLLLTWDEILLLGRESLITIGAHTHNHLNLKSLSYDDAMFELGRSKELIEKYLCRPVNNLAFPCGSRREADTREFQLAEKSGFKTAVTTENAIIRQNSNLFSLPRQQVLESDDIYRLSIKLSNWNAFFNVQL